MCPVHGSTSLTALPYYTVVIAMCCSVDLFCKEKIATIFTGTITCIPIAKRRDHIMAKYLPHGLQYITPKSHLIFPGQELFWSSLYNCTHIPQNADSSERHKHSFYIPIAKRQDHIMTKFHMPYISPQNHTSYSGDRNCSNFRVQAVSAQWTILARMAWPGAARAHCTALCVYEYISVP